MSTKGPSMCKRIWDKLGISVPILLLMIKGAIGPTIGLAMYQSRSVAVHYLTIGYLIPIMTILTIPVFPQARYLQNLLVASVLVCLAAAVSLLAMWCAVKARENTTHTSNVGLQNGPVSGAQVSPTYNAAASANMGIWLFFEIWIINTLRAYRPQYFVSTVIFGIFINVTGTYGTLFVTMKQAEGLVSRLLQTFFTGFGISVGVSLFVVPFSSRDMISNFITQELHAFKTLVQIQRLYMLSLPTRDWYGNKENISTASADSRSDNESWFPSKVKAWPEADILNSITRDIAQLQVKMQSELRFAKCEFAWGKLGSRDMVRICRLLRNVLVPTLAIESVTGIIHRIETRGGWGSLRIPGSGEILTESELTSQNEIDKEQWNQMLDQFNGRMKYLQQTMMEGFDHILYTLELAKPALSPARSDLEANGPGCSPGEKGFAKYLENTIQDVQSQRDEPLKQWCAQKGLDDPVRLGDLQLTSDERHQSQLYFVLDIENTLLMAARGVLDLVKYVESKRDDGTMRKRRFIHPTWKQMKKWLWAILSREDSNLDYQVYSTRSGSPIVYIDDAIHGEKDAEHLPPTTPWQKVTDKCRAIPHFFGSPESTFGFRVATATMTIAIICYLRNSQQFFIQQRLIWGSIMVAISMTQTAGSGIYGQFIRFSGTVVAMVVSYIVWYIVDQHSAGIVVFTGLAMFFYHYPLIKNPADPVFPIIGMVTVNLIVGYELQVQKIGTSQSISNGQSYHPLYELAPFRLATVAAGVGVAFLFTYFPSVVTARNQLRKTLGSSLYLLSHYYSSVHETVVLRIRGAEGEVTDKGSLGRRLEKARTRIFVKELVLLQGMEKHIQFIAWEPTFGGKFPLSSYKKLIHHTQNILRFTAMISHVTEAMRLVSTTEGPLSAQELWMDDFGHLIAALQVTSREVTSLLCIVAAAISTGKPLPPYLTAPRPIHLKRLLASVNSDILGTGHIHEPGYAEFAVMQVSYALLGDDLEGLLEETKKLVGEARFDSNAAGIEILENGDIRPVLVGERRD